MYMLWKCVRVLFNNMATTTWALKHVFITDKQSQTTHVQVDIFARQKSKAPSRVWIVQNNL